MPVIDSYYKKAYTYAEADFNHNISLYPLITKHSTFTAIDGQNVFDDRLSSAYGRHYVVADNGIDEAREVIRKRLFPAAPIIINYCFVMFYSGEADCGIEDELKYLNEMGNDVNFSNNYIVSVIVIIDSVIKHDDPKLNEFLKNLCEREDRLRNKVDVHIFTRDKRIEANFMILIDSVIASVILSSTSTQNSEYLNNRKKANDKIENFAMSLPANALEQQTKFRWQSLCASFCNRKYELIAYILKKYYASHIENLSDDIVLREAGMTATPFGDVHVLKELLKSVFYSIPRVKNVVKEPSRYTFREICVERFGGEGDWIVDISFKTTLAEYRKRMYTPDYEAYVTALLSRLSDYNYKNLIEETLSGVRKYIESVKDEIKTCEDEFTKFMRNLFMRNEDEFDAVLGGYVTRFINFEMLKAKLKFWETMMFRITDEKERTNVKELQKSREEFEALKSEIDDYRFNYEIIDFQLGDIKKVTIREALRLVDDADFIGTLKVLCEQYAVNVQSVKRIAWGSVLVHNPIEGVSQKEPISADYGDYQLEGEQLFSSYWAFR